MKLRRLTIALLHCTARPRLQLEADMVAKMDATHPDDDDSTVSDPVESVHNLNRIFAVMDDLEDILQQVLRGWQPPRIVVIGNQSEGERMRLAWYCLISRLCSRLCASTSTRHLPSTCCIHASYVRRL